MTYLQIVNAVLVRLRENEVTAVIDTPYAKLIGALVNVSKRQVEDSWDWGALRTTITATTSEDLFNYVLEGSTTRIRVLDIFNDTDDFLITQKSTKWFDLRFLVTPVYKGSPQHYNFNGVDTNGDSQVDFYPIPDGVYSIRVNCIAPQNPLSADTDVLLVHSGVVIEGAIALAIDERGDDGGNTMQRKIYADMLSDLIAIESGQRLDEVTWGAA